MDYCHPCRRHLNGALACAGCGTPAEALGPYAMPAPAGPAPDEPYGTAARADETAARRRTRRDDRRGAGRKSRRGTAGEAGPEFRSDPDAVSRRSAAGETGPGARSAAGEPGRASRRDAAREPRPSRLLSLIHI
uniref:SCO2400 family protein n=1 Tax=Streptomyces sp. f51 TaxID=1827742 RepID=UPI003F916939